MAGHPHPDHPQHEHEHPHHEQPGQGPRVPQDPAQESLASALRSGFNVLRVFMIVLVAFYLLSGVFQVRQGEEGLIVRFGKLVESGTQGVVFEPGWHLALPDPFDEKLILSQATQTLRVDSFVFQRRPEDRDKPLSETLLVKDNLTPGVDGALLTGDKNLSHGVFRINYRITTADQFVRNVGDRVDAARPLLSRLADTAVLRSASGREVEDVTRRGIEAFANDIQNLLQSELDLLESGITIDKVSAETIEPGRVRRAFLEVTEAENAKESSIKQAEQESSRILNQTAGAIYPGVLDAIRSYGAAQLTNADEDRLTALRDRIDAELDSAGGKVATRLREARSMASSIRERIQREYEEFFFYRNLYQKFPRLTLIGLWRDMRASVLGSKQNEVFYVPQLCDTIEILTNRDPQRLIEAEMEKYRSRFEPQNPNR